MQKIKSLLKEVKNPKVKQDVESLLKEVKAITKKLELDQDAIYRLETENEKLSNDLALICEKSDDTSSSVKMFIEQFEDTKSGIIAITSWAVFFVSVAAAVYAIANSL